MRVVVGPVSNKSARSWLDYARSVVDDLTSIAPDECFSTPEVRDIFEAYLDEWGSAARRRGPFVWESEIPAEEVEYHMHAFHQVAGLLSQREEQTGTSAAPEESKEFYLALLSGVLSALETESDASAEFAQHLGRFWPGQELTIR